MPNGYKLFYGTWIDDINKIPREIYIVGKYRNPAFSKFFKYAFEGYSDNESFTYEFYEVDDDYIIEDFTINHKIIKTGIYKV